MIDIRGYSMRDLIALSLVLERHNVSKEELHEFVCSVRAGYECGMELATRALSFMADALEQEGEQND